MVPGTAAAIVGVGAAVNHPGRSVPQKVDGARLRAAWRQAQGLLEQQGDARSDAGQGLGGRKEGNELKGPHLLICTKLHDEIGQAPGPMPLIPGWRGQRSGTI